MESCKEYLEKHPDGTYSLVLRGDLCKESDILIPEGAIKARFYPHDPDELEFENAFCQWWYGENKEWTYYADYEGSVEHSRVVWNRDQDEPFLTPECTLNDQYAEIERVRQVEIHGTVKAEPDFNFGAAEASGCAKEKGSTPSSAWDTQVGGNHYKQFKIQPMQFALENRLDAAQQNVIKYIMRHSFKNGKQDLEKAKHYIDLMIEFYYGDNNNG